MKSRFIAGGDSLGSLQGYLSCSYRELVQIFGEPNSAGDEYKISTEWNILDTETNIAFTLYDWKETNMYDPSLETVKKFRERDQYGWHIGGEKNIPYAELSDFLSEKLGRIITATHSNGW